MSDDGNLTDAERRALAAEKRDVPPPAALETLIVATLRRRGALERGAGGWRTAVAASLVLGLAGGFVGARFLPTAASPDATAHRFVLLLYAGDAVQDGAHRDEYEAWARGLVAAGTDVTGDELSADAVEASTTAAPAALSLPEQPRGYFVIAARDLNEASRIASTCPHLRHGGRVVVRPVVS
ncbi:MAG: hypothetical protein U0Q12_18290 [Vicinamibacterales bacterium]